MSARAEAGVRAALRVVWSHKGLVVLTALGPALLALVPALAWSELFEAASNHRYAPGSLVHSLDETFRVDHRKLFGGASESLRSASAALALVALLWGVFTAGGWLQVLLERARERTAQRFFLGGARFFLRFLRVVAFTLAWLQLAGWLCYGWPWETLVQEALLGCKTASLEDLDSELSARLAFWFQDGLYLTLFALALAWADATRTLLALRDTRSVFWTGVEVALRLARHPRALLGPLVVLTSIEVLAVALLGLLRPYLDSHLGAGAGTWAILALGTLSILALCIRALLRAARYAALIAPLERHAPTIWQPDPWRAESALPGSA